MRSKRLSTVADPGFPGEEGANANGGGVAKLLFGVVFAENCMKMIKKLD